MVAPLVLALVAGAVVWRAGAALSRDADALAGSTPLARAFVGVVLLGVATSLPEIATTVTAGVLDEPQLVTGNLLGGVALQVVVLAAADVVASRRSITPQVVDATLLVQHVVLLLLLTLAIAGMAAGEPVSVLGVGLWPVLLAGVYAGGLLLARRGAGSARWVAVDEGGADRSGAAQPEQEVVRRPALWRLGLNAGLVLVAGYALARSAHQLAQDGPLQATAVGAVLLAVATSLPEISTVRGSLRAGAYDLAVANIVGTNCLEVALLLVADVALRSGPVLASSTSADVFTAALAAVLTCLYLAGLLLRHDRRLRRAGPDSVAVIVVYLLGMAVLVLT